MRGFGQPAKQAMFKRNGETSLNTNISFNLVPSAKTVPDKATTRGPMSTMNYGHES
jgi:hypothetical protein